MNDEYGFYGEFNNNLDDDFKVFERIVAFKMLNE